MRVADLHRKIGAALWHKGERKQAIEHYQKGINLLKDGEPWLELVRLYEEAASLYMHTGDNMLAIYASEKALRLAEKLGETRVASRAHGIFGRVFGRIGDTAKARENLERAVELARDSDARRDDPRVARRWATTSRSPRPTTAAPAGLRRGARARPADRRRARTDRAAGLVARLASTAPTGRRCARRRRQAASSPSARAWSASSACRALLRGVLSWREGDWDDAESWLRRSHELAEQVAGPRSAFAVALRLGRTLRDRGDLVAAP